MEPKYSEQKTQVVGTSIIRQDSLEKLTGKARYSADIQRPGMLHAVTVRSSESRMSQINIEIEKARQIPGVKCIATEDDIPGDNVVPLVFNDQPFLAVSDIRFHGEPVALIAADTFENALRSAEQIKITGNSEDPCIDPLESLSSESPRLFGSDNVFKTYTIKRGNLQSDFNSADIVWDQVYQTPHQVHGYLEAQGMFAEPDDLGGIRIIGSMQCPFYVQDAVAAILNIPKHKVVVIQSATGGGFGGKEDVPSIVAGHAALLAWLTRKPVQLVYSREEDFRAMSKRHPSITRVKIAANKEGILQAIDVDYILNGGAYATLSPIVLWRGAVHSAGPYNWRSVNIRARAVATNTVPSGAFRGFGQPQVTFAIESAVDEIARELGIDPLEIRLKNGIKIGDVTATGHRIRESCGLSEGMERGAKKIKWQSSPEKSVAKPNLDIPQKLEGKGCAISFYGLGLGAGGKHLARAGSSVQIENDGSVRVYIGNTEMGQGARSVIGQIAAEALNAPYEAVLVNRADTSRVPDSGPTVASRTTVMSGNATLDACRKLRSSLQKAAAKTFGISQEEIVCESGQFFSQSNKTETMSYRDVVIEAHAMRLPMSATGWFVSPDTDYSDSDGQGNPYMTYVWSANFAHIEIDTVTLEVTVKKLVAAHDVGKALNPREVSAQIQGGALQGIGYALLENLILNKEGHIENPGFHGYIMPTAFDVPEIIPVIVEHPFSQGPFGAKGIGEPPLIAVAPAIANAVEDAIGIRVRELPLCPEKILDAIIHQQERNA